MLNTTGDPQQEPIFPQRNHPPIFQMLQGSTTEIPQEESQQITGIKKIPQIRDLMHKTCISFRNIYETEKSPTSKYIEERKQQRDKADSPKEALT